MQEVKEFVLGVIIELLWPLTGACQIDEMSSNSLSLKVTKFLISSSVREERSWAVSQS